MRRFGKIIFGIIAVVMAGTILFYLFNNVIGNFFVKNNVWQTESKEGEGAKKAKEQNDQESK